MVRWMGARLRPKGCGFDGDKCGREMHICKFVPGLSVTSDTHDTLVWGQDLKRDLWVYLLLLLLIFIKLSNLETLYYPNLIYQG